jgi:hypothetical protein
MNKKGADDVFPRTINRDLLPWLTGWHTVGHTVWRNLQNSIRPFQLVYRFPNGTIHFVAPRCPFVLIRMFKEVDLNLCEADIQPYIHITGSHFLPHRIRSVQRKITIPGIPFPDFVQSGPRLFNIRFARTVSLN